MNIGGSKVLQGSSSYDYGSNSLSSYAARAGLVMKLGKVEKPSSSSELQARLKQVEQENTDIKEKFNVRQQNNDLMARHS